MIEVAGWILLGAGIVVGFLVVAILLGGKKLIDMLHDAMHAAVKDNKL